MKSIISLDKDKIKLKGKWEKVIIQFYLKEVKPWYEPNDDDADVRKLYQIMQNNEENIKPRSYGQIHLGSPMLIGHNSDLEFDNWEIENFEARSRKCCSINEIPWIKVHSCF
jgi:hypothetical protein